MTGLDVRRAWRRGGGATGRALAAFAVMVLALWWIGRGLLAPLPPAHSVTALLGQPGTAPSRDPAFLQAPDAAAVARARALMLREPLAAEGYAVLALAAAHAGRDGPALRLMRLSADWWPRDLLVQSWLLARSLRGDDPAAIVTRFDLIARVRPDSLDAMTAAIAPALGDPATNAAFAARLAADPPWRTRFLDIAVRLWRAPAGVIALMDRLQTPPAALQPAELRAYLAKLLATRRVDQAYAAWLRSLPPGRLATLGYLYNGRFSFPVTDVPFDWQTPATPRVRVLVDGPPDRRVLTVGFLGGRVATAPVRHVLALAPGAYRLTGRVATDRLRAERGVRWRITCLDDPDRTLAASDSFKESTAWRAFSMDVTLPDTGCGAQLLSLEVEAPTVLEQEASGIASFADLGLARR